MASLESVPEESTTDDVTVPILSPLPAEQPREIFIDDEVRNAQFLFINNIIKTTKYNFVSFLPKNLFEQFHRAANVYFLCIAILNWIPQLNVFGKEISCFPIILVLTCTAVKDAYEDSRRRRSDKEINTREVLVIRRNEQIKKKWENVQVSSRF